MALVVEHPVNSNFKMYSILILVLFTLFYNFSPKVTVYESFLLEILGARRKKQCYCFFHGAPCIQQFQNVYCSYSIFLFDLQLFTQIECVEVSFFSSRCSAKEPMSLHFPEAPCI